LVLFSVHLLILYFNQGNDVNCGCMGSMIPMKPIPSILKNIGMIVVLFIGLFFIKKSNNLQKNKKHYTSLAVLFTIILIGGVFVVYPLNAQPTYSAISKMYKHTQPERPKQ